MASAGTAYVDVEAKLDQFSSDIDAAVSSIDTQTIDVEAVASTDQAQAEIDSIEGGSTEIAVEANTEAAQQGVDDLSGSIGALGEAAGAGGAGGAVGGLVDELGSLVGVTGGVAAGLGVAVGAFGLAINAAGDAQAVTAETDSIISSLGSNAVVTGGHIGELSQRVMEYSGFSDEAVRAGANTLLMFDNINNEATFDRAIEGAADLARRMGTDVPQAARMLGLALQDPEAGMNRLRRAGVVLTDAQKEQIAAFMETGDVASAQGVILDSLQGRIGNLAEDYGSTMKGGMDKARESMDELAESAGSSLLPMMEALSASVVDQVARLQSWDSALNGALFSGPIQAIAGIGDGMTGIGRVVGDMPSGLSAATAGTAEFADAAGRAKDEIDGLSNSLTGYLDGAFAVPEAQRNVRDSFSDLFGVLLTEGHSADDVAQSLEAIAYNTANLGAATGDFQGAADLTIQRLRGMRDAGQITATQFDTIKAAIRGAQDQGPLVVPTSAPGAAAATGEVRGLGDAIRKVPPTHVTEVHTTGTATAIADVDAFKRRLDALPKNVFVGISTSGSAAARASGGPVESGRQYLVGEEGPEMFVPRRSGTIIPAAQTAAMTRGTFAPVVNVYAPSGNGDDIARAISDELRKLERAGR